MTAEPVASVGLAGVHHVSLNVVDLDQSAAFYTSVLGLEQIDRPDLGVPGVWLQAPDGRQVHLIERAGFEAPRGQHFAFAVADVEHSAAALARRGVAVSEIEDIPGGGRQCFFRDPTGNLIELNQGR